MIMFYIFNFFYYFFLGIYQRVHFALMCLSHIFRSKFEFAEFIKFFFTNLFNTIPIIAMTAFFSGAVMTIQTNDSLVFQKSDFLIMRVVALSIIREIGPVIGSMMITCRLGTFIASELSSMKVFEQIDAIQSFSVNPISYLFVPRVLSLVLITPILILLFNILSMVSSCLVLIKNNNFFSEYSYYINYLVQIISSADMKLSLIKSVTFGLIIGFLTCYHSYICELNAKSIGIATINAIIEISILIFISDYFITLLFIYCKNL